MVRGEALCTPIPPPPPPSTHLRVSLSPSVHASPIAWRRAVPCPPPPRPPSASHFVPWYLQNGAVGRHDLHVGHGVVAAAILEREGGVVAAVQEEAPCTDRGALAVHDHLAVGEGVEEATHDLAGAESHLGAVAVGRRVELHRVEGAQVDVERVRLENGKGAWHVHMMWGE